MRSFRPSASKGCAVPPFVTQLQEPAVYPEGPPDSEREYVSALTSWSKPPAPEMSLAPVPSAVSSQSAGTALPPLSVVTVFTSVRCAASSSFRSTQRFVSPGATETEPCALQSFWATPAGRPLVGYES